MRAITLKGSDSMVDAFFTRDGDLWVPTDRSHGPWSMAQLHGRMIAAVQAQVAESLFGAPDLMPARLTVDMFRAVPWAPLKIDAQIARDGRRVRSVDVSVTAEGVEVTRASVLFLRRSEEPPGKVATPPFTPPPPVNEVPLDPQGDPSWEGRTVPRKPGVEPIVTWMRTLVPLLEGVPLTPFVRAATSSDSANPFGHWSDDGLHFVNADVTLYLHREPVGEWIGLSIISRGSADGVGVANAAIYDETGPVGHSLVASLGTSQDSQTVREQRKQEGK